MVICTNCQCAILIFTQILTFCTMHSVCFCIFCPISYLFYNFLCILPHAKRLTILRVLTQKNRVTEGSVTRQLPKNHYFAHLLFNVPLANRFSQLEFTWNQSFYILRPFLSFFRRLFNHRQQRLCRRISDFTQR